MKRILSLVLVLVLALGSVPVAFADNHSAGEMLKEAGFVAGDQDGNLNEDQKLTREQMMVLIAEMNGVKEEAATFSIPFDFTDVNENDWFAPYVWYAAYQGWTAGMGDGSFGAGVAVDSKMAATFMLKALDYEVTDYNASVAQAADLGIEIDEASELTRGQGFKAMWSTVNLPKKDSDVALGVELGRLEPTEEPAADLTAELDAVEAIGNMVVKVEFSDDVDAAAAEAADYVITEKGSSEELEIKDVTVVDSDWVNLETAAMEGGKAYTLTLGESAVNFTGISKDSDKPEVDSITGEDTDLVKVEFDMVVDRATAEDIANYSVDKIGTVTDARLDDDNKTVFVTVEGFTKSQAAKMTVENVMSIDGVLMSKETKTFYPEFDTKAPKLEDNGVDASDDNNVEVIIYFDDEHGVDKATAEDISNYSIDGLEILKAEADDVMYDSSKTDNEADSDYYGKVTLTTSEQQKSKKYTLKVLNMVDGSTSANAITSELTEDFYGGDEDDQEPDLTSVNALSLTMLQVVFDEDNYLDPATALDTSNYEADDNEFDILDAQFKDGDDEETTIWLTVSTLDEDESYKLIVNNISDTFGNAMEDEEKDSFDTDSDDLVTDAPTYIDNVEVVDLETIKITFAQDVTEATMEDPTNYVVDGDIGRALETDVESSTVVKVTFEEMDNNESYEVTVNGVETFSGYATEDAKYSFVATSTEQDTTRPEVEDVDNDDQGKLLVEFSEKMELGSTPVVYVYESTYYQANKDAIAKLTNAQLKADTNAEELDATHLMENDKVVVFAAQALESANNNATDEKTYVIHKFVDVKDLAGLVPDYESNDEDFTVDNEYDEKDYKLEFNGAFQENVKKIYIEYGEDILVDIIGDGEVLVTGDEGNKATFTLDTDDDNEVVLEWKTGGKSKTVFEDNETIKFNLSSDVADVVGRAVMSQDIEVKWDADDDAEPEIDVVRAINDRQIEIVYDEDIAEDEEGSYRVEDEDEDGLTITNVEIGDEDNIVLITFSSSVELNSGEMYTLEQRSLAKDLQGNRAKEMDDPFKFPGNSTPYVENTIDGIAVINGNTVKILDDEDLPKGTYKVTSGSTTIIEFDWDGVTTDAEATSAGVSTHITSLVRTSTANTVAVLDEDEIEITVGDRFFTFVEGQTFKVEVDADAGKDFTESFEGVVEELTFNDITVVEDANSNYQKATFVVSGIDEDDTLVVYINESESTNYTRDDDEITITDENAYVKVLVLEDDSDLVIKASDNIQIKK